MICSKSPIGWAPIRATPFTRKPGVPGEAKATALLQIGLHHLANIGLDGRRRCLGGIDPRRFRRHRQVLLALRVELFLVREELVVKAISRRRILSRHGLVHQGRGHGDGMYRQRSMLDHQAQAIAIFAHELDQDIPLGATVGTLKVGVFHDRDRCRRIAQNGSARDDRMLRMGEGLVEPGLRRVRRVSGSCGLRRRLLQRGDESLRMRLDGGEDNIRVLHHFLPQPVRGGRTRSDYAGGQQNRQRGMCDAANSEVPARFD